MLAYERLLVLTACTRLDPAAIAALERATRDADESVCLWAAEELQVAAAAHVR